MNFGLTATLLLRLDARMDQWEHVLHLASHCGVQTHVVADELERMVANGLVLVERNNRSGLIERAMVNPRYGT